MSDTEEAFESIIEIMKRHGAKCSPAEFHAAVNVTFHQFESEVYDTEHADMWNSLPQQFALFAQDCLESPRNAPAGMRVLDIGCGTGLASDSLLKSALGNRITSVDLLDTSSQMLRQAGKRAAGWGVPVETHEGLIDSLPPGRKYELIVTCSVLHHVPDLPRFAADVRRHQADGGIFLHLQDPNGEYAADTELKQRTAEFSKKLLPEGLYRFTPKKVLNKLQRVLSGPEAGDHVSKTNQELLRSGIVTSPLTVHEVYAITDIHVADGAGISIDRMKAWMPDYELISRRSYGFFGVLWDTLPPHLRLQEEQLIQSRAQNGLHVGAAWKLK